ncbi:EAL domain-containing protein [Vibrio hibernica]|uniref:EAL domain-containing protein n=1 Tax=Vibrio hibernica TaxID=2587465 RepID=UPI0039AFAF2F
MTIDASFKFRQWGITCITAIGCFLFGVTIVIVQGINNFNSEKQESLNKAVVEIENILDTSSLIIDQIMPLASEPCQNTKSKLVDLAIRYPEFQTVSLLVNSEVVCSTYNGLVHLSMLSNDSRKNELILMKSKVIEPGKIIGVIKKSKGKNAVSITLNGRSFFYILSLIDSDENFQIQAFNQWVGKEGVLHDGISRFNLISYSPKYNFNVHTYISFNTYVTELYQRYGWIILLLVMLSIVISRSVFLNVEKNSSVLIMKKAINKDHFVPYGQPIMNANGELAGLEILIRWNHKSLGVIYPDAFIPLAERSGLIIPMTRQLFTNTIHAFEKMPHALPKGFHIAINICAQHFEKSNQQSLIDSCREFLASPISQSSFLVLELTERGIIENYGEAREVFDSLHDMGVRMAVDDFGTGNASLSAINNLNFDYIKVDKSFIDLIGSDAVSAPLVDNIIDLARRLNLSLTAEGVENQVQVDYLKENGVDHLQGYFYGKPVPLDEFIQTYLK